jgi:uncharacterized secreted protein with C-terminal beta-propeller domain
MTRRALAVVTAVALLSLSGCTGQSQHTTFVDPGVPLESLKLVAFDDCQDLLNGLRSAAKAAVGPYGFGGAYPVEDGAAAAGPAPLRADSKANEGAAPAGAPEPHSTTNTHEAGVDEPDLVKTDGKRIVTVAGGILRVVDAASRTLVGSVDLDLVGRGPSYVNLLLDGDHVMVLGQAYKADSMGAQLTLVDIAGPPTVLGRYTMDGAVLDARQIGSTARVVVQSQPRIEFPQPLDGRQPDPTAANRQAIDNTPVEGWLPRYTVTDASGRENGGRVDCGSVSRPSRYSGTTMLTVLTFDLAESAFDTGQPVSIVADGQTVYANGPSLYVAGDQRWQYMWGIRSDIRPQPSTELYKFDISGPGQPRVVAGGKVDGWLLNQYSLSEWDGNLRVATTAGQPWSGNGSSQSTVYVLRESGGQLRELGHVGGLGRGERIYAVRFIGTVGYVVTFKQTDPLYTIDLSDARAPKVTGALKITGYSAYLHPIADGQLIGVGQDASTSGRIQGLQVSLFDVRDVARPTRLTQYTMKSERTEAEFDPHAFLYWAPRGLVVLPVSSGMLVLAVHDTTISEAGMITTRSNDYPQRALVIGDTLWTVSMQGLQANDLTTLERTAWLPNT